MRAFIKKWPGDEIRDYADRKMTALGIQKYAAPVLNKKEATKTSYFVMLLY
jgi:hypothetical protein